jgi:cytochrome P450
MSVAQIMLPALFQRFPDLALYRPDQIEWYGFTFRGPLSVPVSLGRGR